MTNNISTASKNVSVIDHAFFMPQLNRSRRIWLYLPASYQKSKKRFPVLYMHDGQNLFNVNTSFSGEWQVDETLDSTPNACIVVGIDNGGLHRMNEYNPYDTEQFGKGEGLLYLEFIVETLKPYIDKKYRTLRSDKHTIMAGSSMGGLISFYAGILYPQIFGRLGIFSPAFWIAPHLVSYINQSIKPRRHSKQKYYFYGGGAENANMVSDIFQVAELMHSYANPTIKTVVNPAGYHSEDCWKKEFPAFFQWIISS